MMKKLLLTLAVAVLGLSGANPVGAVDSCTISNTGPDSTNSCTIKNTFTCEVSNDNKITVFNENKQVAGSGSATVDSNTTGGNATSGSASNENGTTFAVKITNGACAVTAVNQPEQGPTPSAPTAPVSPSGGAGEAGGKGAVGGKGAIKPVAAPQKVAPTVLPNTSAQSTVGIVVASVAALGATIGLSRLAVSSYGRIKS